MEIITTKNLGDLVSVRTAFDKVGRLWYLAKDLHKALGYDQVGKLLRMSPERRVVRLPDYARREGERNVEYAMISEYGFYLAVFRSLKPEARPIQEWLIEQGRAASGTPDFIPAPNPVREAERPAPSVTKPYTGPTPEFLERQRLIASLEDEAQTLRDQIFADEEEGKDTTDLEVRLRGVNDRINELELGGKPNPSSSPIPDYEDDDFIPAPQKVWSPPT